MNKQGIKTEDYREINEYWFKRLVDCRCACINSGLNELNERIKNCPFGGFKKFNTNTMTLGYPKSTDTDRILKFKHKGIEIRTGNPEWGAEPGKLYFVILHGELMS